MSRRLSKKELSKIMKEKGDCGSSQNVYLEEYRTLRDEMLYYLPC